MLTFFAGMACGVLLMIVAVAWVTRRPMPGEYGCTCPECVAFDASIGIKTPGKLSEPPHSVP